MSFALPKKVLQQGIAQPAKPLLANQSPFKRLRFAYVRTSTTNFGTGIE
jgi:hypothetical protein